MHDHALDINLRILDAIETALLTYESDPLIAYLNDDYELRLDSTEWINNLEHVLKYFEAIEDYDKCTMVVTLLNKVKTFLGKDLVN
tara:strand:+ start:95 stop:352 length:258 start_codon:yes stop_codon:yes gene_type:complete